MLVQDRRQHGESGAPKHVLEPVGGPDAQLLEQLSLAPIVERELAAHPKQSMGLLLHELSVLGGLGADLDGHPGRPLRDTPYESIARPHLGLHREIPAWPKVVSDCSENLCGALVIE